MTREAALIALFESCFDEDEFRMFLAGEPDSADIRRSLPGRPITLARLISDGVGVLRRRGLDRRFFERLLEHRPLKKSEIHSARALWIRGNALERGAPWGNGRYQLVKEVGRGGFAYVWEAVDGVIGRTVALKVLMEHRADDCRVRQRFSRGASALAQLSHPGIVRVISDVEQEGLYFYFTMELIRGSSLRSRVDSKAVLAPKILDLVLKAGDAIAYVHYHGMLHRDINPDNILVTSTEQVKIIDFDLVSADGFLPLTTTALGTPDFSPPEAKKPGPKTPAYDVYGLARTTEFVLANVKHCPSQIDVDGIQVILRNALHPDPEKRTASVAEFCQSLRGAMRGSIDVPSTERADLQLRASRRPFEGRGANPDEPTDGRRIVCVTHSQSRRSDVDAWLQVKLPDPIWWSSNFY